jgi:hypothetical protein
MQAAGHRWRGHARAVATFLRARFAFARPPREAIARATDSLVVHAPFRVTRFAVLLRKESKRGLLALAVLAVAGMAAFASAASSAPSAAKNAFAPRLLGAR